MTTGRGLTIRRASPPPAPRAPAPAAITRQPSRPSGTSTFSTNGIAPNGPVLQPTPPPPAATIDPSTIAPADWTFFVHLAGDNSLDMDAKNDLAEMERVGSIPGKVNIFALV